MIQLPGPLVSQLGQCLGPGLPGSPVSLPKGPWKAQIGLCRLGSKHPGLALRAKCPSRPALRNSGRLGSPRPPIWPSGRLARNASTNPDARNYMKDPSLALSASREPWPSFSGCRFLHLVHAQTREAGAPSASFVCLSNRRNRRTFAGTR